MKTWSQKSWGLLQEANIRVLFCTTPTKAVYNTSFRFCSTVDCHPLDQTTVTGCELHKVQACAQRQDQFHLGPRFGPSTGGQSCHPLNDTQCGLRSSRTSPKSCLWKGWGGFGTSDQHPRPLQHSTQLQSSFNTPTPTPPLRPRIHPLKHMPIFDGCSPR